MTHLMQGEAIHFHVCLAHNDLHDDYLGDNDDDNDTKSSHSSCRTVTRFSQTQLERLLTVRHDDYLLFMKRKWIVINVFILMVVMLRTQGGGRCVFGMSSQGRERPSRWRRPEARPERQAHSASLYRNTL